MKSAQGTIKIPKNPDLSSDLAHFLTQAGGADQIDSKQLLKLGVLTDKLVALKR